MATEVIAPELIGRAHKTSNLCAYLADDLSRRAEKKQALERLLVGISNVIGIVALIVAFFLPTIRVGASDLDKLMTAISALVLIVVPYIQMAAFRDPPSRYQDFSFYIGGYSHKIDEIVSDVKSVRRYERLMEVLALADKNINDVRVKWPRILNEAERHLAAG